MAKQFGWSVDRLVGWSVVRLAASVGTTSICILMSSACPTLTIRRFPLRHTDWPVKQLIYPPNCAGHAAISQVVTTTTSTAMQCHKKVLQRHSDWLRISHKLSAQNRRISSFVAIRCTAAEHLPNYWHSNGTEPLYGCCTLPFIFLTHECAAVARTQLQLNSFKV